MIRPHRARRALVAALLVLLALAAALAGGGGAPAIGQEPAPDRPQPAPGAVRFAAVDVLVDAGTHALGAYQFELAAEPGDIQIVGVEGGEHPAFADPPYYDPRALAQRRIVIAAFSTARDLPTGNTRVARVHLRIAGAAEPDWALVLRVAAGADGTAIPARASVRPAERK